jgi:hypothetical protein
MTTNTKVTIQLLALVVLASVLAVTETATDSIGQLLSTVVWLVAG